MGSAAGVGEGAVLSGAVVADRMHADDLATGGDLDDVADDRDLHLAAAMFAPDFVVGPGEADRPARVDLAGHGLADGGLARSRSSLGPFRRPCQCG